jgi:hypothetical protein
MGIFQRIFGKKNEESTVNINTEVVSDLFPNGVLNDFRIIHSPHDLEIGDKYERHNSYGDKKMYEVTMKEIDENGYIFIGSKEVK